MNGGDASDINEARQFHELASLANVLFGTPIALIYLTDRDHRWLESNHEVKLAAAFWTSPFCHVAAAADEPLVVIDADNDPSFCDAALVTNAPHVRFFAGAPLITPSGTKLGVLCVFDFEPRAQPSPVAISGLSTLARWLVSALELRDRQVLLLRDQAASTRLQAIHGLIAEASSCERLLESVLNQLCAHHHASIGHVYRYDTANRQLAVVCRIFADSDCGLSKDTALSGVVLEAISADMPTIAVAQRKRLRCDSRRLDADDNMVTDILLPIFVADWRFAISLTFDGIPGQIDTVTNDISYIAGLIHPHLKRQILAQRAALLTKALDCALDGVLITDLEINRPGPKIVYANASMAVMTGYTAQELIGQSPRLLQGPDTDRVTLDVVRGHLESSQPLSFEIENYRKDGSRFLSEIIIMPVSNNLGNNTHFVSIQRDITERRRREDARGVRELLNRSLFDSNPMPMWIVSDKSHQFLQVNNAAIAHYGWSRDEFLKMTLLDIRTPAEQQIFLDMRRNSLPTHINARVWAHLRADGSEILVRSATHLIDYDGQSASMSVVWDVTEIERSQRQQAESHQKLTKLAAELKRYADDLIDVQQLARLGSWRHRIGSQDVQWSDQMYSLMGSTKQEAPPTLDSMIDCIHPDDQTLALETFQRVLNTGTREVVDLRVLHPSHSIIQTCWHARQYCDAAGAVVGVYGYCQDITESKLAEDALRRSDKLKSLGQLTGGIAHDFNNLLTVVTLNLEDVMETLSEDDPTQRMLHSALHAAQRGAELTGQLLSYSRRAILRPLPINVSSFIEAFRPLMERSLGKRYTLRIAFDDKAAQLLVDPAQLDSALLNLVINARDSMPDGGEIQMTVTSNVYDEMVAGGAEHSIEGRFVIISVIDEGMGITSENLNRVFEPFFTTKGIGQGSGLGLSMVYGFAKQSGGHVSLHSALGKGTTARLYLPQHQDKTHDERDLNKVLTGLTVKGLRVLVVEDQLTVLNAVIRVLEAVGFEVATARSAAEAQVAMRSSKLFDLLITDIMLAGPENGINVAQHARKIMPDIQVILTTGFTDYNIDSVEVAELNAKFLIKPYRRFTLYDMIQEMFPQSRVVSDEDSV